MHANPGYYQPFSRLQLGPDMTKGPSREKFSHSSSGALRSPLSLGMSRTLVGQVDTPGNRSSEDDTQGSADHRQ